MKRIIQNLHKLPPQPASMAVVLIAAAMLGNQFCPVLTDELVDPNISADLGWLAGSQTSFPGLVATLARHRWAGTTTALLACATLAAGELYHRRGAGYRPAYLVLLTVAAVLVGVTGHLGASLIYGPDYLSS